MKKGKHVLTNDDIAILYTADRYNLMVDDFTSAFAYWATRLNGNETYGIVADAIGAYARYLQKTHFKDRDTVVNMTCAVIRNLTDENLFFSIPEIAILNGTKPDFISLGALSRNVFYCILREQITQPIN